MRSSQAIVGIKLRVQTAVGGCFYEQGHVRTPIAGNDRIRFTDADLGNVRRKILNLAEWVQIIADDGDIRPFAREHFACVFADLLAEQIILIEKIDTLSLLSKTEYDVGSSDGVGCR